MSLGINEFFLIIGWSVGVYIGCRSKIDRSSIIRMFFALAIQVPIIEESLFRVTHHSYISEWPYSRAVNAVLFGLFHLTNFGFIRSKIIFFQVVMTMNMGYYLSGIDNFVYTTLIHACYNISAMVAMYAISKYQEIYIDTEEIVSGELLPYPMKRLMRSKSVGKDDARDYEYAICTPRDKLVVDSVAKFDEIVMANQNANVKMILSLLNEK
jgi:hypothetical protein